MTHLLLWRHGITDSNAAGRYQGQSDVPLNETGIDQAKRAAQVLADVAPDALYTSPLSRATVTADALAALTGLAPVRDDRLAEINVGSWTGRTHAEILVQFPQAAEAEREQRDYRHSPEGETASEVGVRVAEALREIAARHDGQTVVVASHGLAIKMGICELLGWSFETSLDMVVMGNCSWCHLVDKGGRWRLVSWNESVAPRVR